MRLDHDIGPARGVARGLRQKAWLAVLTSADGLHRTDSRRRYGSVTAERIEQFLSQLYAVGYTIASYATPPQRTARWHLVAWEGPAVAAERGAALALCQALQWRIVPQSIDKLAAALDERCLPPALELVGLPGLVQTVERLASDQGGSPNVDPVELAFLTLST